MKKTLLGLLLIAAVCVTFMPDNSEGVSELHDQDSNHLQEITDKFTDKFWENRNSDNKFVDKAKEKINKDYTWIVYKLWKADSE